jgi:hypothetical protein
MSRSRRKTPVTGITKAERDTRDKVLAHRRRGTSSPRASPSACAPGHAG